jgi:hypothetical protein
MALESGTPGASLSQPESKVAPLSGTGATRRRLATAGASGVLMTLASQKAMAALVCESPSGSLSGGIASRKPESSACAGVSPGYWKNHSSAWRAAGVRETDAFNALFSCGGHAGYSAVQCGQILSHQKFDENNIGMHMMASYLNVASGRIGFMSVETLQKIWSDWMRQGYYVPTKGAMAWRSADIVMYLKSTMS